MDRNMKTEAKQMEKNPQLCRVSFMGSIKLHIEPIVHTAKHITPKCLQKNNSTFNNIMTHIPLVCNSTTSRYNGGDMLGVKVTRDDTEHYFLYNTEAQSSYMPLKSFKRIYSHTRIKKIAINRLTHKEHRQKRARIQKH
jgi:hypothetical protein